MTRSHVCTAPLSESQVGVGKDRGVGRKKPGVLLAN